MDAAPAIARNWSSLTWARMKRAALDLVFPPQCMACRDSVAEPHALCARCWATLSFVGGAMCPCCGAPFDYPGAQGLVCGACLAMPPKFSRARAALRYDDASRDLILAFKHADRLDYAPAFGLWLARAGAELLRETDAILPVPLHWRRLLFRRFNQSAELARALGRIAGIPVLPGALVRTRATPSQGRMQSALARRRNVRAAFAVRARAKPAVAGKRLLLVDDVMTTGATVNACAGVLVKEGAADVAAVTLARVVRPAAPPV